MTDHWKPRRRSGRQSSVLAAALLSLLVETGPLYAQVPADGMPLQLEVSINGTASGLIGAFVLLPDGRMAATAAELGELGLKVTGEPAVGDLVVVDQLPNLSYSYDASAQTINFITGDENRVTRVFDAQAGGEGRPLNRGLGSVLNYGIFGAAGHEGGSDSEFDLIAFNGGSLSLDHRLYSAYGALLNTGIIGTTTMQDATALRLDSSWTTTREDMMLTGTLGDSISGGLSWTRPIRMGGLQLRRNFDVRPDLITMPLPQVSGSAAVPSTVDVFVNNVRTYSQQVPSGPFVISNIPVVTGSGDARIVVRDATGRETESVTPFATSSDLLRPGLLDYSANIGFARLNYGEASFDYGKDILASGTLRRGITNSFTLESHAEAGGELLNGGLGGVYALGNFGMIEAAVSASTFEERQGLQVFASLETELFNVNFDISSQRSFGDYSDLAYSTALVGGLTQAEIDDFEPYRALDRITAGFMLPDSWGSLGFSAIHIEEGDGENSYYLSSNFSRGLPYNASLSISGFAELGGDGNYGVNLDISAPLGGWGYGSVGGLASNSGASLTATVAKPRGTEDGSYGWRTQVQLGETNAAQGQLSYRTHYADTEFYLAGVGKNVQATAYAEGALVVADGGVFASRRIDDAFAIVDVGAANVRVEHQNQPVGRTGKSGKILVPDLTAYEANSISIVADDLPMNADFAETEKQVTPAELTGASVHFGVKPELQSAIVVLRDTEGRPLAPGTEGVVSRTSERFVVGYDGQAYIKDLQAQNEVTMELRGKTCKAIFAYQPKPGEQILIEGVTCQ